MSLVIVLHRPQDLVNIASVIRIMKNFGLRDLRLVAPAEYDAYRVEGIAHQTGDVLKRVQVFEALDPALAGCHHVVGFTARQRSAKRNAQRPREAAGELLAMSEATLVALVFGPEDQGLTNDELDRCHRIVTIPTSAEYPSLNLAQAVAVMAYELFLARGTPPLKPPRRAAEPARQEQLERLFEDARAALEAIDFFKTRRPEAIMRTVREVIHRTPFDAREVELARA
ncbi:MAG: TrmJ/YjtD family RNA methyltransferase, partial [Gemmatimonadetes bacterium]|nr:TrmJ/YjtD family RNA methyltransferase [Gemmatimonadota bacterium]